MCGRIFGAWAMIVAAEAVLFQQFPYFLQKQNAADSLIGGIRIRKMLTDIAECCCSKQCVHHGMYEHIRIRMS